MYMPRSPRRRAHLPPQHPGADIAASKGGAEEEADRDGAAGEVVFGGRHGLRRNGVWLWG